MAENLRSNAKNAIVDVILSSTSHGLPNIFRSNNLTIRLMWIFFTTLSTGLCAFMITKSIIAYFNYEVTTNSRIINEFKPNFPTITICNLNFFTSEYSKNLSNQLENSLQSENPLENKYYLLAKTYVQKLPEFENNKRYFGDSLEKMIIKCMYQTYYPCERNLFRFFYHPYYGNCYSVNSGLDEEGKETPLLSAISTGRFFAIKLILNISVPDELEFISPNSGAIILIHNQTSYPMQADEITVMPGVETNIALSRTYFNSMPKPYSNCDRNTDDENSYDSDLFKLIFKNLKGYNQISCVYFCFQRLSIEKCKCYFPLFPSFNKAKPCDPSDDFQCVGELYTYFSNSSYINDVCLKECPLECKRLSFQRTISINKFGNKKWIKNLKLYDGIDSIFFNRTFNRNEIAVVNIFFESLSYINIEEIAAIDFVGLLSNIGGVAGLFLGVSFLSFVEIFEVFIQLIVVIKNNKKVSN